MNEPDSARPEKAPDLPKRLPSKSLAFVCALHGAPLLGAAIMLPWYHASWFTVVVGALAALHGAVAAAALTKHARWLTIAWQALAVYSLALLVGLTGLVLGTAFYLIELYRGIGRAVAFGLFGVWALFVLFTVPISVWCLSVTPWPRWWSHRAARRTATGVVVVLLLAAWLSTAAARAEIVWSQESSEIRAVAATFTAPGSDPESSLFHSVPAACRDPVDGARLTLLVTTQDRSPAPLTACLQETNEKALAKTLERWLTEYAKPGSAVKLDLVRAVHDLTRTHPLIDALKLRPALDGACGAGKCLAPWQLVALDSFTSYRPLDDVRDASFGCSLDELASALGSNAAEHLARIETESLLARDGRVARLLRLRRPERKATPASLAEAVSLAERHILSAQERSGAFRYLIDPFTGKSDEAPLNLPRQAGTILVLCELARDGAADATVRRALDELAGHERKNGDRSALVVTGTRAQLGHSALPLIAFVTCRERVGEQNDALIARLARLLLDMQRDDGGFHPEFDLRAGVPRGVYTPLYSAGQAVFALVLVERLANAAPDGPFPERATLRRALDRAMDYYANDYWPRALRSLFYLEENWHCLAARAALTSHRHDGYERFCLDYVGFKSRLILEPSSGVDPEHVGGYSLSNMLPPHSTATAGFGEALAAAIPVKEARGLPVAEDRALLKSVLEFVLRQQWTADVCFACAPGFGAIGGFSETLASPPIRIDYVQHAMAALGHGRDALGLVGAR